MTRPNRIGMYEDVRKILDAALENGGGEVELRSYGAAVHWRQRAYKFRKLFVDTVQARSPYDRLTLLKTPEGSPIVTIRIKEQPAVFRPINRDAAPAQVDPELMSEAEDLAKRLGLGDVL
mgnify:FL=1